MALAEIYCAIGDLDLVVHWVEQGYEARRDWMPWIKANTINEPLYNDRRFQEILRRLDLPRWSARNVRRSCMEGETYLCTWKKEGRGFRILVKNQPDLQVVASTFDEAREKLWELILEQRGDGESALDFDKPLPSEVLPAQYARPEIVMVSGNDSALVRDAASLFDGGICTLCNNPVGPRNELAAQVSDISGRTDGAISFQHVGWIFSEEFVHLLSGMKGGAVQFRQVEVTRRVKKKFFELIGPAMATEIAVRDYGRVDGVECPHCKRKTFCQRVGTGVQSFLARSDLPKRMPPCFAFQRRETMGLCMTGKAWRALQGTPGTRNILGEPVGVAPDDNVVRDPALPLLPRKKGLAGPARPKV